MGDRNFTTFSISVHNADSVIFATNISYNAVGGLLVAEFTNHKRIIFALYGATQNTFDMSLPIAEHMINSIKILSPDV